MVGLRRSVTTRMGLSSTVLTHGEGPPVLLLHGFPDTAETFEAQMEALAASGFSVYAPTLMGYEPASFSPDGRYFIGRVARHVVELADALGLARFHVVGHDWGAVVGYALGGLFPRRMLSLSTLAVPHVAGLERGLRRWPSQLWRSRYIGLFQWPGVAEARVRRHDYAYVERLWSSWSPGWQASASTLEAVKACLSVPGVLEAALTYYRDLFRWNHPEGREVFRLMRDPIWVPTLALTGATDGCVGTHLWDHMSSRGFPQGLRVIRVEGAGHFMHQERPGEVSEHLVSWLQGHAAG